MATTQWNPTNILAYTAAADLRGKENYFAKQVGAGGLNIAGVDEADCVIIDGANTGNPVSVQNDGVGKVIANAIMTGGTRITSDANGKAVAAANAAAYAIGKTREDCVVGQVVSFVFGKRA